MGKSTDTLRENTHIDYRLRVHGLPLQWQSRIEEWTPNQRFVDVQVKGPYRRWHHTHSFQALGKGTLMRDRVEYEVPLGAIGRLLCGAFVRRDLRRIFAYRTHVISRHFSHNTLPR